MMTKLSTTITAAFVTLLAILVTAPGAGTTLAQYMPTSNQTQQQFCRRLQTYCDQQNRITEQVVALFHRYGFDADPGMSPACVGARQVCSGQLIVPVQTPYPPYTRSPSRMHDSYLDEAYQTVDEFGRCIGDCTAPNAFEGNGDELGKPTPLPYRPYPE